MGFARWWFNRFREFRTFKWYYNPRWLNVELGENAEPTLRAQLKTTTNKINAKVNVPPELEEIRQAYENKAIDSVEQFRKNTNRLYSKLWLLCRYLLMYFGDSAYLSYACFFKISGLSE